MTASDVEAGVLGYVALGAFLDQGLRQQTQFDLAAFEKAASRTLTGDQRARFVEVQHQANRWTYIGSGMSHPKFLETLGQISASGRRMIEKATPTFI